MATISASGAAKNTPSSAVKGSSRSSRAPALISRGGHGDGPPTSSSEGGYAPLGLPRPSLGRAPAKPWRASGSTEARASQRQQLRGQPRHQEIRDEHRDAEPGGEVPPGDVAEADAVHHDEAGLRRAQRRRRAGERDRIVLL